MSEHHNLADEFPEHRERIHQLKMNDRHFGNLFEEYHNVDRELLRIEQSIENPSDQYTEDLKKKRVQLKDALYKILQSAG